VLPWSVRTEFSPLAAHNNTSGGGIKLGRMMLSRTFLPDGILRRAPYERRGQCPSNLRCSWSATSAPCDIS
jgi:hypothetical protein